MTALVVVSGLPGTGRTTLARTPTRALGATYLRVDAVESPLVRAGVEVDPFGYEIVGELAQLNLLIDRDVIVDLVNPLPITRSRWWAAPTGAGSRYRRPLNRPGRPGNPLDACFPGRSQTRESCNRSVGSGTVIIVLGFMALATGPERSSRVWATATHPH